MQQTVFARPKPPGSRLVALATAAALAAAVGAAAPLVAEAEVPAGWRGVARDSFSRTTSSGWGSAELGGAYSLTTSGATPSTSGSAGVVGLTSGASFGATLDKVVASDVDLSSTFVLDAGSASSYELFSSWAVRQQIGGSAYTARVRFSQTGTATLAVARKNGSTSTALASVNLPFPVRSGQSVRGELQTTGTSPVTVRARAWVVGSTRPAWQIQHVDSSSSRIQSAGSVGIWSHLRAASTGVRVRYDDVSVGAAGGTGSTPTTPVAVAPPPVVAPAASGGRGTTLGSTSYPIPAGARFVDAARGSDSGTGSSSSPYKTVSRAVSAASRGNTIVVRAGTYHETVIVPDSKPLTIQNYPGEVVWFDGSVRVTNWVKSGSAWVSQGWRAKFDSSMGGDATFKARFVNANPMAADADQVFVNGAQLRQVGSLSQVVAGTFYVNDSNGSLTIGSDPGGKEVRASALEVGFQISGPGSTLQGVGVRRYATTYQKRAAVKFSNVGGTARHLVITDNAMMGLLLSNVNKVVDRNVVTNNGMLGINASKIDTSVIRNSVVSGNNTQNFKDAPVAGGIKIHASRGITVANNEVKNNQSMGIWFDVSNYDMKIVGNDAQNNRGAQIELEVSAKAIVANNTAIGGSKGILIFDTSDVKIWNNEVGGSAIAGIHVSQDRRRQAAAGQWREERDPRRPIPDPTMPWISRNIVASNNVFGNGGYFQYYALDKESGLPADALNLTVNGNLFNKRVNKATSQPTMVAWGLGDNRSLVRYETPAEFKAKNSGWNNAQAPGSYSIQSMGPYKTQFASVALPLPADVAAAAGLPAGSRKLGRY